MANVHRNPYPGLRPFRPDEEHLFFGRELQVDKMISKLKSQRFLAVVGGSGSGKSSLVNCGLRPALHRGYMASAGANWRMVQFRPGSDPIRAMTRALSAPGVLFDDTEDSFLTPEEMIDSTLRLGSLGLVQCIEQAELPQDTQLLIVVDQFEELFRYGDGKKGQRLRDLNSEKTAFIKLLLEAVVHKEVPIHVVVTMRSDFLGDCTQFEGLPEAINDGQYLVPRLTRQQIRAAITGPAQIRGEMISPVLTTRLLNDLGDNPDQLSILQHALNRTWAHWESENGGQGQIDLPSYTAIGGLKNALDKHAEKAFNELPDEQSKLLCEKIFKALTDTGTDTRGTRRITPIAELMEITNASFEEIVEVAKVFRKASRSFLMPPEGEEISIESDIDISHESLMRLWKRLRLWTREEASSARTFRNLRDTAIKHAKGDASLWHGPELNSALTWRGRNQPTEKWAQRYGGDYEVAMDFLHQSNEAVRDNRGKERGRKRARIAFWGVLIILLVPMAAIVLRQEFLTQLAKSREVQNFVADLALFDEFHREKTEFVTKEQFCNFHVGSTFGDTTQPLWSAVSSLRLLEDFCMDRAAYFSPSDDFALVEFASLVHQGNLDAVNEALRRMPSKMEWPAYQLLGRLTDLRTQAIIDEQLCLTEMLGGNGEGEHSADTIRESCENVEFQHPFHRPIYKLVGPYHAVADDIDERMARLSDDHLYLMQQYGAVRALPRGKAFSDMHWIYVRMGRKVEDTGSLAFVRDVTERYAGVALIFLLWPLWYIRRWWNTKRGHEHAATPSSHRRLAATLFDGAVAVFLGFALYTSLEFISLMRIGSSDDTLSFAAAIIVTLAYLLYCDAIRFRYCRSLGKIAFDMRPLMVTRSLQRKISIGDSARRNAPKVMALILCAIVSRLLYEYFQSSDMKLVGLFSTLSLFGGSVVLYLIILIVAWNERRIDRLENENKGPTRRVMWLYGLCFVVLTSAPFVFILVMTPYMIFVEIALVLILWGMLTLPYVVALVKPNKLARSRVVDDESQLSVNADMLPRYSPSRIGLETAAAKPA